MVLRLPARPRWLRGKRGRVPRVRYCVQVHRRVQIVRLLRVRLALLLLGLLVVRVRLLVLAPRLQELLMDHFHLDVVMLKHIVASPLLKLSEFAALYILCSPLVHDDSLLILHLMQLLLLSDQPLSEAVLVIWFVLKLLVRVRVRRLVIRSVFIHKFKIKVHVLIIVGQDVRFLLSRLRVHLFNELWHEHREALCFCDLF